MTEIDPNTPVLVEWWTHRWIPSKHHAVVVPHSKAVYWYVQGAIMQVHWLDDGLLRELSLTPPGQRS